MLAKRRASTDTSAARGSSLTAALSPQRPLGAFGVTNLSAALIATLVAVSPASMLAPSAAAQPAGASQAQIEAQTEAARLWNDFSHYVLIARPDLAAVAGEALLGLDDAVVLAAVEADDRPIQRVFSRASGMEASAAVSTRLEDKLAAAARAQSRDPQRIAADVARLANSQRAFDLAVDNLSAAGAYAAPELLNRLRDPGSASLHPYVIEAMEAIGRPLVDPLAIALPELDPVAQGQVARVLAAIGYPAALPALKEVAEDADTDGDARRRVERAFATIANAASIDRNSSADRLYAGLGTAAYAIGSRGDMPPGFQPGTNSGPVWVWSDQVGLVPIEVPGALYADAIARAAATKALALAPDSAPALSLFLAADLRSANRSTAEMSDPSRAQNLKPADYYLSLAGPERAREVLDRALADGDGALALSAIRGAEATGSTEGLAPLARALRSAEAQVRFAAASALAAARPRQGFSGDSTVIPTLSSAIRRSGEQYAVVLAADEAIRNTLSDASSSAGFQPLIGGGLDQVVAQAQEVPGIDLIVARGSADDINGLLSATAAIPALAAAPVVAFVSASDQITLNSRFGAGSRLRTVVGNPDASNLEAIARGAVSQDSKLAVSPEQAEAQALEALALIRDLALDQTSVLQADAALPAVVAALEDPRAAVATAAGETAASLDDRFAQEALARVALEGPGEVQVAHLRSLAASATRHGNLLPASRGDDLLALVSNSDGEVALAAAAAHGALTLPTEHAVTLILNASQ